MGVLLTLSLLLGQVPGAPPFSITSASPAASYAGRTIVRVDFAIEGRIGEDEVLRDLIETRVGSPLSMASVRETIAHLHSLGRFQEISVDAAPLDGGVGLRYDLVPIHSVLKIDFTGSLGLSRSDLRRAVTSRFGAAPPAARASAAAELLQGYYFERGYLAAAIRPVLQEVHDPEGTILIFEIESGARAHIRNVDVSGDPGEPRDRFLAAIHANPGRPYERVEIQEKLTEYIDDLRRDGRYEARGSHRIVSQSDDGRSVDIAVSIDRGPEVLLRFEGDPLPENRIDELVPVTREGSVDIDILEDSERRIVTFLNQQGYWKASATATRREVDGRIEIAFTVRRGLQYRVADPRVTGNASVPLAEIQQALENLQPGEVFVAANLDAAAAAIRGIYLRRGFARVKVESAANELPASASGEARVQPAIVITEGSLIRIGNVTFKGNEAISSAGLSRRISTTAGAPYYEPQVISDRDTVVTEYLNRGFEQVAVNVVPTVAGGSRVDLRFDITEGPQSIVDHILVVGNVKTDARVIEREVQLQTGQPLGLADLVETRRRLGSLGLFRRIQIDTIQHGESNLRDILITVEEAPSTTIGYGGGAELSERLATGAGGDAESRTELAPRGFFEIGRRNIAGKNRSASLYTRLSLRSDDNGDDSSQPLSFPEYRVVGTFREPRAFGWNADATMTAAIEQGVRSTFKFSRKALNAEIERRFPQGILTSLLYSLGTTRTFDEALTEQEQATIDRVFPQVRLSMFALTLARDTRDDPLNASRGLFLTAENSVAARALGGQVGFIKSFLQAHAYRRLPIGERVVLAGRVAVGLADGFPREVTVIDADGVPTTETIEDLPASERFFAGGDTTMRGFALDSVGASNTITVRGFPLGGNGMVLMNAELRVPMWKDLGGAVFVDTGNVFERVTQIDLGQLRASAGVGLRYRTPAGPVRFDIGFKLGDLQVGDNRRYALHFSIGQAF